MKPVVSDETLNAFVDGELDVAESEALIARMREDKEVAQRVCALRSLQSMVLLAYIEPPVAPGPESRCAGASPVFPALCNGVSCRAGGAGGRHQ